jgi:hypothetical protein
MQLSWLSRRRIAVTALPFAVLVSLAACSSSATPAASLSTTPAIGQSSTPAGASQPAVVGSCSVVTEAQASAALGQPVTGPFLGKATVESGRACVYYGSDVPAGTSPNIPAADTVRVVLVTGSDAKKFFDNYKGQVHAVPIHGLGDHAFYDGYASISVLKGDEYVRIAVGVANNLAIEKKLAADALTKM